jgi:hypothetical protein
MTINTKDKKFVEDNPKMTKKRILKFNHTSSMSDIKQKIANLIFENKDKLKDNDYKTMMEYLGDGNETVFYKIEYSYPRIVEKNICDKHGCDDCVEEDFDTDECNIIKALGAENRVASMIVPILKSKEDNFLKMSKFSSIRHFISKNVIGYSELLGNTGFKYTYYINGNRVFTKPGSILILDKTKI